MNTLNINFRDKTRKNISKDLFSFSYRKNFLGTEKRVRIRHGERAIDVRVIKVILYF